MMLWSLLRTRRPGTHAGGARCAARASLGRRCSAAAVEQHWRAALEAFIPAAPSRVVSEEGAGGRRPEAAPRSRRRADAASEDDPAEHQAWRRMLRRTTSSRVAEALAQAVREDSVTETPRMRLELRDFGIAPGRSSTDSGGHAADGSSGHGVHPVLRMLGEAIYLQWRHGFPRTPQGLSQLTHGFFNYPAGMQPAAAAVMLTATVQHFIGGGDGGDGSGGGDADGGAAIYVLDPCCGSGTTLVETQRAQLTGQLVTRVGTGHDGQGGGSGHDNVEVPPPLATVPVPPGAMLRACGGDVSPLAVFVATGQTWRPSARDVAALRRQCSRVVARTREAMAMAAASGGEEVAAAAAAAAFERMRGIISQLQQQQQEQHQKQQSPDCDSPGGDADAAVVGVGRGAVAVAAATGDDAGDAEGMAGPLWFCFLVAMQRGAPLMPPPLLGQQVGRSGSSNNSSRRKERRRQRDLDRRRARAGRRGRWQQQWGRPRGGGGDNDDSAGSARGNGGAESFGADAALDLFEAVVAEYAQKLDWAELHHRGVPESAVVRQASVLEAVAVDGGGGGGSGGGGSGGNGGDGGDSGGGDAGGQEGGQMVQCVVTSPPYPAVYDYLSFARKTRSDFDRGSAPQGRDWSPHWSSTGEMGAHKRFKQLRRNRGRAARNGGNAAHGRAQGNSADGQGQDEEQTVFQMEWLREHHSFLRTLGARLAPGGVAAVMIGDGGVRDHDLVTVDTLATTLALAPPGGVADAGDHGVVSPALWDHHGLALIGSATARSVVTEGRMSKRTEHVLLLQKEAAGMIE